jgi:hypothetical protein
MLVMILQGAPKISDAYPYSLEAVGPSRQVGEVLGVALLGSLVAGGAFVSGLHLAGYICAGAFLIGAILSFSYLYTPGKRAPEQ